MSEPLVGEGGGGAAPPPDEPKADGPGETADKEPTPNHASFECNICLDPSTEPVITLCGHLYCWPCIYPWINSGQTTCPVCKSHVSRERLIPLYGRGGGDTQRDPRATAPGAATADGGGGSGSGGGGGGGGGSAVPERPRGQQEQAPPPRPAAGGFRGDGPLFGPFAGFGRGLGGGFSVHFGWGGGFGSFGGFGGAGGAGGAPMTPEDEHRVTVSRMLLSAGMIVLVALMYA